MTHNEAADAIMEVMQNFVNAERKKIWELAHKQIVKKLKDYVRHHNTCKICLSPPKHVRPCSCGLDETLKGYQ